MIYIRATAANSELSRLIYAACLLEAMAKKPGNVHPEAAFADLKYADFVSSAEAVAPVLAAALEFGVGATILESIRATRKIVRTNTNLGIVLLLAPLAAVPPAVSLTQGIRGVLDNLTQADAELTYQAIRLAQPGGLGQTSSQDISRPPTETLLDVMRLAADRDLIAAQYATDFELVLEFGAGYLAAGDAFRENWESAVMGLQLELLARQPDSLIVRKCGIETATAAMHRAQQILAAGWPRARAAIEMHDEFDRWLREDGHRRNPGTTADLIAACLFAAFRDGKISVPEGVQLPCALGTTDREE